VAAINDMQKRFTTIFGDELAARLEFRTINGISAKIIGYYGRCVGKKPFELVTDEGYKTKLLSAIYTEIVKQYPTESDLKNISTLITYIKNMQLSENEINKYICVDEAQDTSKVQHQMIAVLANKYKKYLW
jgi:hypothetical protein